jgi:uncharacterized HAD superfamily protein
MKKTFKTKIAYDFDGVLCSTMPAFHQYWKEKYNWKIFDHEKGNRSFEMPMPEDYNFKFISKDIEEAINKFQSFLYPHAYAMELVREMANNFNEQPIIITARNAANKDVTDAWLKRYLGIPYVLYLVGGDTGENKPKLIEGLGVKYFVEDRFKTVNSIKSCRKVFMPDRPWNGNRKPNKHVLRVRNLIDVWGYVASEESKK